MKYYKYFIGFLLIMISCDSLKDLVSESEVERMKNQFVEDLADKATIGFSETIEYSQIYSSFLYCNGEFVWSGTA